MPEPREAGALPAGLARTSEALTRARTLPALTYTGEAIHALEARALFATQWLVVAREEELPAAGSFVTRELANERILVVRDEAGHLRAYFNVCRHRGARLVTESRGQLHGAIRCPYHAWSYGFDGRLQHAPRMGEERFDDDLALESMPLAAHDGFVWVNLDAAARSFDPDTLPDLRDHDLAALRRAARLEYELACNWKIVCENYSECYHCPGVHPQLNRLSDLTSGGFEAAARYNGGPMQLRAGVDTLSTSGRSRWPRLAAAQSSHVRYYLVYPNLMLGLHPDYLLTHRVWPLAPSRSRVDCEVLVRPEALAAPDFDPTDVVEFWDLTNRQDWTLCERVQQGVSSRGYRPGPYHPSERCVHAFDAWYAQWLSGALQASKTIAP